MQNFRRKRGSKEMQFLTIARYRTPVHSLTSGAETFRQAVLTL
jgi:hypothetical protein